MQHMTCRHEGRTAWDSFGLVSVQAVPPIAPSHVDICGAGLGLAALPAPAYPKAFYCVRSIGKETGKPEDLKITYVLDKNALQPR